MRESLNKGSSGPEADEARQFLEMAITEGSAKGLQDKALKILARSPDYVPALFIKSLGQEVNGDFKGAANSYETILKRYPLFAPASRRLALLYFGRLANDEQAYQRGLAARKAFPADAAIARIVGIVACRKGDFLKAAQVLNELPAASRDAEASYYLGLAQYRLNHKPESRDALERALALELSPPLAKDASRILAELKPKGATAPPSLSP
jgi:tetratricopeptide (TPR) repeat protein